MVVLAVLGQKNAEDLRGRRVHALSDKDADDRLPSGLLNKRLDRLEIVSERDGGFGIRMGRCRSGEGVPARRKRPPPQRVFRQDRLVRGFEKAFESQRRLRAVGPHPLSWSLHFSLAR